MSGRGHYLWRVGVAALLAAGVQPELWAQIDAVFANSGQQNRVCLGDGNGDSSCSDISGDTNGTSGVALGFVDGDDHLDAVFANSGWPDAQPNRVCLGDGNGGYSCSDVSGDIYYGTSDVALGFVDDDRNLDAVFAVVDFSPPDLKDDPLGGYILCLGDGNGGFSCSYFGPACSSGLALGYVDGDRRLDAVFANSECCGFGGCSRGENVICLGDGNGDFSCSDVSGDTNSTAGVALGFVDRDTKLEAVFANLGWPDPQPNRVCLGDGSGGFSCSDVSADANRTSDVALGEMRTSEIFTDGFESGDTSTWSRAVP